MNKENSVQNLMKKYQKLKESLIDIGLIQQGTILPRTIQKNSKTYGPYHQWTKKINGKTVTFNLTPSQADTYNKAIEEYKKLKYILNEMMDLSNKILDNTTQGVIKRKKKDNE